MVLPQRFTDEFVSREGRYSLGRDGQDGVYYLSIPVANSMVDYEEYYRLSEAEMIRLRGDQDAAKQFADQCHHRLHDDRLILVPGKDRGVPL